MNKGLRNASGVITVMVSLLLIPLLSFGTLIMEAGRYVSAKQLLADAQITASMSILANYNTYLYERFGILAIDPDATQEQTKSSFVANLKYNSDNVDDISSSSKLYNLNSDVTFETIYNLSDYTILKRQVLEYAKYSVPYEIISNKLDPKALFDKIAAKITDNAVFDFIEKIALSSEESVNVMDKAFTALGRYEYRTLDLLNYLSADSNQAYTSSSYTQDLYWEYIYGDAEINYGTLSTYFESARYVSGREDYITAITNKTSYMAEHPDPQDSLDAANAIDAPSTSVSYSNLYKAAIKKFLEKDANKPTDDNPLGASINSTYNQTKVELEINNTYDYTYDLAKGDASVIPLSGSTPKKYTITEAVRYISGDNTKKVENYTELEQFAEDYNITLSASDYLSAYNTALEKNGKAVAKSDLIDELTEKKNEYDDDIDDLNGDINTAKTDYVDKLNTAKDKFNELIKSIEDDSQKIKKLVTNDEGEMVEGTEYSNYNEGAVGRLSYAQETYESNNNETEGKSSESDASSDAEALGSNSDAVEVNAGEVISQLNERKTKAQNAVTLIDTLITNVSDTQASSIEDYWESNGADYVTGSVQVGATCGVLAGYVSSDFSTITTFVETPVVDAEGSGDFGVDDLAGTLGISDIWDAITKIKDILNFVPATHDEAYVVTLNAEDISLLPTMTGGSESDPSEYNKADAEYAEEMRKKANQTLGKVYEDTDLYKSGEDIQTGAFTTGTAELFGSGGEDGSTESGPMAELNGNANDNKNKGILKLVAALKEIVKKIKDAFTAIKNLFGEIKRIIGEFVEESIHSLLINTYIIQKFPNRMKEVAGATTYPVNSTEGSYFSGCCVEYCMFGNASEKKNQSSVFWLIFGIKAVMNCIQILTDPDTMSIISSCNIFAPLMFIAMLYMETNIDMNYLLRLGQEVPIWKDHLNLSVEGLGDILEDLVQLDGSSSTTVTVCTSGAGKRYHKSNCWTIVSSENRTVETKTTKLSQAVKDGYTACQVCKPAELNKAEEDAGEGIIPLDYTEYLYVLMLFMSTKTKLGNLANLIQLETRYYESEQDIKSSFRIDKASTYVRSQVTASYDTLLPMFSLGSSGGFNEIGGVEYVGY